MKYLLKFLEKTGCSYSWITLWVGRHIGLIETSEVTKYAEEHISDKLKEKNPYILEMAWNNEPQIIDENLQKLAFEVYGEIFDQESSVWIEEARKWRYCILKKLRKDIESKEKLLEKIAEVYSDMGYPKEMERFIYYMPITDGYDSTKFTKEENQQRMVRLLDEFLEKEKAEVIQ